MTAQGGHLSISHHICFSLFSGNFSSRQIQTLNSLHPHPSLLHRIPWFILARWYRKPYLIYVMRAVSVHSLSTLCQELSKCVPMLHHLLQTPQRLFHILKLCQVCLICPNSYNLDLEFCSTAEFMFFQLKYISWLKCYLFFNLNYHKNYEVHSSFPFRHDFSLSA